MTYHPYYKLNGKAAVPCELEECTTDIKDRRVKETYIAKNIRISTVFLTINHGSVIPILFETMAFDQSNLPPGDDGCGEELECERYSTWDEAIKGHNKMVQKYLRKYVWGNK